VTCYKLIVLATAERCKYIQHIVYKTKHSATQDNWWGICRGGCILYRGGYVGECVGVDMSGGYIGGYIGVDM